MPKDKSHQMDFRGLEILADEFTGTVTAEVAAGDVEVTPPGTDATWTDVQAALDDIAARLALLEV